MSGESAAARARSADDTGVALAEATMPLSYFTWTCGLTPSARPRAATSSRKPRRQNRDIGAGTEREIELTLGERA